MEEYLSQLRLQGLQESSGSFTLNTKRLSQTLGGFSLPRKTAWLTKLLQYAAMEASVELVGVMRKKTLWEVRFRGSQVRAQAVANLVLRDGIEAHTSPLSPLQFLLRYLLSCRPERVTVTSTSSGVKEVAVFQNEEVRLLTTESEDESSSQLTVSWTGCCDLGTDTQIETELKRSSRFVRFPVLFQERPLAMERLPLAVYGHRLLEERAAPSDLALERLQEDFGAHRYDQSGNLCTQNAVGSGSTDVAFLVQRCDLGQGGFFLHWSCHGVPLLSEFSAFTVTPLRIEFVLPFPLERADLTGWNFRGRVKKKHTLRSLDPLARNLLDVGLGAVNGSGSRYLPKGRVSWLKRTWTFLRLLLWGAALSGVVVGCLYQIAAIGSGRGAPLPLLLFLLVFLLPAAFLLFFVYSLDATEHWLSETDLENSNEPFKGSLSERNWTEIP